VRVAALLDPEILQVELFAVTVCPEQIGVAFTHRDDVGIVDKGNDPLLLGPNPGAIRVYVLTQAIIEQLDPGCRSSRRQRLHIVTHFEKASAFRAAIDDFQEVILPGTIVNALKPRGITHDSRDFLRLGGEVRNDQLPIHLRSNFSQRPSCFAYLAYVNDFFSNGFVAGL